MAKIYRIPMVAALGAADVLTAGISGPLREIAPPQHPTFTGTTHWMLDL